MVTRKKKYSSVVSPNFASERSLADSGTRAKEDIN